MISLATNARLACDHEGCSTIVDGKFVLLSTGGFTVRGPPQWQAIMRRDGGPALAFCPEHRRESERIVKPLGVA